MTGLVLLALVSLVVAAYLLLSQKGRRRPQAPTPRFSPSRHRHDLDREDGGRDSRSVSVALDSIVLEAAEPRKSTRIDGELRSQRERAAEEDDRRRRNQSEASIPVWVDDDDRRSNFGRGSFPTGGSLSDSDFATGGGFGSGDHGCSSSGSSDSSSSCDSGGGGDGGGGD